MKAKSFKKIEIRPQLNPLIRWAGLVEVKKEVQSLAEVEKRLTSEVMSTHGLGNKFEKPCLHD